MDSLALSPIDWIMIGIVIVSTLVSILRGFIKEALSLGAWIAALIVSRLFAGQLSTLLVPYIDTPSIRLAVAYGALILGTLMVSSMLIFLMGEVVKKTGLSGFDRFLGMWFGLARGGLIVMVVIAGLYYLAPVKEDKWWQDSRLIPYVVVAVEYLQPLIWQQRQKYTDSA